MERVSIDEVLAQSRQSWEQVQPHELAAEFEAESLVVDIRPVEQRDGTANFWAP